ncbi:anti-repressor protein [Peptostreptococcus russellii]|uniref:Anti-repressor protein n=1 Tax=Peptostreptococcus russellii TaxID=215200 RepID=A0A1H8KNH7_9FIRM|nr:phage antirepressor KilAC domain-containing protein [Peptostreptococcus russellii]SEN94482.1 anti-repressor protein [Peptostreptococcus russellii]
MNELQIFNNSEFGEVRVLEINNEPWFVGKDVAEVLGYKDINRAVKQHVAAEDLQACNYKAYGDLYPSLWNNINDFSNKILINESGLYDLIFASELPSAKKFKRWVTSEVLPTIRKHGMYATEELLANPDLLISVAQELKVEREKRKTLEAERETNKPKVLFADSVQSSKKSILVGELAKLIKQNGVDIGQNRLFAWLRKEGYLISRKGESFNLPTQRSMELGVLEIKESTHINPDGSVRLTKTPKVTGKGQIYFINKFRGV